MPAESDQWLPEAQERGSHAVHLQRETYSGTTEGPQRPFVGGSTPWPAADTAAVAVRNEAARGTAVKKRAGDVQE